MKKSDYRKFIIRGDEAPRDGSPLVRQNDDFASMCEAVTRRYRRLQEEKKPLPGLILIDGGIGQLHAAAQALESLQIINQPLVSIAKKEEILYVLRPGRRAHRPGTSLPGPASHPANSRRDAPLRRDFPPPAPRHSPNENPHSTTFPVSVRVRRKNSCANSAVLRTSRRAGLEKLSKRHFAKKR